MTIEGYGSDGSINYPFYVGSTSFVSHAHGWSTGPTHSLLNRVVGLSVTVTEIEAADGDSYVYLKPFIIPEHDVFVPMSH
jgi:hypothetical protein